MDGEMAKVMLHSLPYSQMSDFLHIILLCLTQRRNGNVIGTPSPGILSANIIFFFNFQCRNFTFFFTLK